MAETMAADMLRTRIKIVNAVENSSSNVVWKINEKWMLQAKNCRNNLGGPYLTRKLFLLVPNSSWLTWRLYVVQLSRMNLLQIVPP